jgi:DNA helicase-2/ATP-dependent DNA helicase PcrA
MQLDLERDLNPSQLDAVTTTEGPVLVIAGAGSGKTRTVCYRLAYLAELGIDPESILLLTFTRKAAQEMLTRASHLVGQGLHGITGGTFHSFAHAVLRRYAGALGLRNEFTVLDRGDSEEVVRQVKEMNGIGKGDRSFPKKNTIMTLVSKSRNKEMDLKNLLEKEAVHLLPYLEDLERILGLYREFKREHSLLDYDDLLFELERLLLERSDILEFLSLRHSYIMVDEYQDTNLVQGRIVKHLAGEAGNIMAVGDDAQSIYSFRGATVSNILRFTSDFPGTRIVKLEQNYRSIQPILTLSNRILSGAQEKYEKHLFSERPDGAKPQLLRPISDQTQAQVVLNKVMELSGQYSLHEIAVLFRAGFQSYPLEVALNKAGISYQKYGGIKFTEAAHIKDVLAYLRLVQNVSDLPAWQRVMSLVPNVGPRTAQRLYESMQSGDRSYLERTRSKNAQLREVLNLLEYLRQNKQTPYSVLEQVLEHYLPLFRERFADDHPRRQAGLDQLSQIAGMYSDLETFLADMSLENPDQLGQPGPLDDTLVLSTVHSAKGLEWSAVIVLDLVEDRFPSKHGMLDVEAMEEERRLFYVACTRAREYLGISMPDSLHNRFQNRSEPAVPSPFVQELQPDVYEEMRESYAGNLAPVDAGGRPREQRSEEPDRNKGPGPEQLGYCTHRIFGRGKVVEFIPPNKYKVNFPGFGLKVIIGDYLRLD